MEEQVVKRKRGRPKKVKLPEEVQTLVKEVAQKTKEIKQTVDEVANIPENQAKIEEVTNSLSEKNSEWDVPKDQYIKFFDKRLSYELTGYKPITADKGLDFNPDWFTVARDTYLRTGKYTEFRMHSKPYNDFWEEEYRRCREGYTVNGYTITGPNYYYLNYYQLPNIDVEMAGSGRPDVFPTFLVFQYEFFHYFEICRKQRKDVCLMKARGVGFSEINASICACIYNCFRQSKCLITTSLKNYLEKSLDKAWNALDFGNEKTQGGFAKLRQAKNTATLKRATVLVKDSNGIVSETGWGSQIEGIVADSDAKIRGDRIDLLVYEEAGSNPVLRKSYIKGKALIYIGGTKFGIRMAGGTGGDKGAALEGLRDMYYDPDGFDVLPFYHNYTETKDWVYTGYFIPSYIGAVTKYGTDTNGVKRQLLDDRGYCLWENYKAQLDLDREALINNPKALIDHSAEYCYTAEEAFALEGENKFNKVNIAEQLTRIRALKLTPPIEVGRIGFHYKDGIHTRQNIDGVIWEASINGKVKILERPVWELPPKKDEYGKVIWEPPIDKVRNLYVIGVDGIDIGKLQTSDSTKDPSDFCLTVYKRAYGMQEPQFVAIYKDRPNDIRDAYKITVALAYYYNASINIEATRQSIIPWARDKHFIKMFMKRPSATLSEKSRTPNKQYGTPATVAIIDHQTDLIADYVNDYCHLIWFDEMLDELNRYTDENKGKFDIVAAMAMALLADEELQGVVPKKIEQAVEDDDKVGYYTDEKGIRRWGVIPKENNNEIRFNNNFGQYYDRTGIRTSDPRVSRGYI